MTRLATSAFWMLLAASGAAQVGPPTYEVHFLGQGTSGAALNEFGTAVGWITSGGVTIASISHGGQPMVPLPLPAGFQSSKAYDVNDLGLVVGVVSPSTIGHMEPRAAIWRPTPGGYVVEVPPVPAGYNYSAAFGVNDIGDVVGALATVFWWSFSQAVHFTSAGPVLLPGLSTVVDVNNNRKVLAGNSLFDLNTYQMQTIPLPPGNWNGFAGYALNEVDGMAGTLIGWSSTCGAFPVRYMPNSGWTFVGGCGQNTGANALNDLGDAMTWAGTWAFGVNFEGIGYYQFGSLIDPSQGPWIAGSGGDINNQRQMLVGVKDISGNPSGVALLSPMGLYCQKDLGYGGPGELQMAMCGGFLTLPGTQSTLTISGGTPNSTVYVLIGSDANPTPLLGGWLVPNPLIDAVGFRTDLNGDASVVVPGSSGVPYALYIQALDVDLSTMSFRFSNALEVRLGS
ncbi:MAG: hypothetical protein JNJ88_14165 [Planctomycetes bacterium]|nr:hypothetical protein [Planctomycetota bacterium]